MDNIRTVMSNLPSTIGGFTIVANDYFTIVLNQNLSFERNMQTYNHELMHISNGDFDKKTSVGLIEIMAHEKNCIDNN